MKKAKKVEREIDFSTKLKNLPDSTGVYLFRDSSGRVIYVGKAKSLKNRVRSYFTTPSDHPRIIKLVSSIRDLEMLVTDSELEALILESNLIKEYQPRYNVNLKDDKRYPHIKITDEVYPRVLVVRRIIDDKAKYFGPYTNVRAMRQTLKFLRKVFPVRSCNLVIPSKRKYRVCLDYYIGRCPGCCEPGKTSPQEYAEIIEGVVLFLSGRSEEVIEKLEVRMNKLSKAEEFEKAANVRDQIAAIKSMIQKQKVVSNDLIDRDIIAMARSVEDICIVVLQIRKGVLIGRQHFYLTAGEEISDSKVLSSFILRYYKSAFFLPSEIFLTLEPDERSLISQWFISQKAKSLKLYYPKKGEKHKLVGLAEKNAHLLLGELLAEKSLTKKKPSAVLINLQRSLYLKSIPLTIAACDISNLGGTDAVGSIVFFSEAKPLKKGYRRFKIKTVEGQDDCSMMAEVITRYFNHLIENREDFPDLLLIDGGKGQLGATLKALKALGIESQQCVALAKRFDEIYLPNRSQPIGIPKTSSVLKLLQRVRNEAHRFAINYHRKLRTQKIDISELDKIPGIGDKRKYILLGTFGSVEGIKKAKLQELLSTSGVPRKVAVKVYEHFHQRKQDG